MVVSLSLPGERPGAKTTAEDAGIRSAVMPI